MQHVGTTPLTMLGCHEKLAAGEQWDPGVNIQTETEALAGLLHRLKLNDVVPTCFVRFMDL